MLTSIVTSLYLKDLTYMLQTVDGDSIATAAEAIINCIKDMGTIYVIGNGGSAANAQHFACDIKKGLQVYAGESAYVECLSDNTAVISAIANDMGYEYIYSEQLRNRVGMFDVVVAISCSGNSKNIIEAVKYAKEQGAIVISLTGYDGGILHQISSYPIIVKCDKKDDLAIQQVEDTHAAICHILARCCFKFFQTMKGTDRDKFCL